MIDAFFIIASMCAIISTIIFIIWVVGTDSDVKRALFNKLNWVRLPFKFPYKYSLGGWEKSAFHTKSQCRNIEIIGNVTKWFGIIEIGVKENGLWGYTVFMLKGVGVRGGFQLEPDTDLIRLLSEGKDFSRIFTENSIELHMEPVLGESMKELETKINNLKVIERITDAADRSSD